MFDLENHKRNIQKNPFATPKNYFEENEKLILQKVKSIESPKKSRKIYPLIYLIGSAAAIFVFFFSILNNPKPQKQITAEVISTDDIPYDYFDDVALEEFSDEITISNSGNDETIDYLIEEDISLELIAENYAL